MDNNGRIKAICVSDKRGIAKRGVDIAEMVRDFGINGDAHADRWHRQVSILTADVIEEFNRSGGNVKDGDFGENLIIDGINQAALTVWSTVIIKAEEGDVILRITQLGKECHSHCEIYKRVGDCIMPRCGLFAEVIKGGRIRVGDKVEVHAPDPDRPYAAAVIVLSDRASAHEREDASGPCATKILTDAGFDVIEQILIPDDKEKLKSELLRLCDKRSTDLVITSGGTGFSVRDITPDVTMEVAERNAPGIAEYMRQESLRITSRAMLSRGVSVIRGTSIIVNLPGSPKAVSECLGFILDALTHGIAILRGDVKDCTSDPEHR